MIADFSETTEFNKILLSSLESIIRYNVFLTFVHLDFEDAASDLIEEVDSSIMELYRKLASLNFKLLHYRQAADCMVIYNTIKQLAAHSSANIQLLTVR